MILHAIYVITIIVLVTRPQSTVGANTGCLCLEEVATGMVNPLTMVEPADGTERLFVTSQDGFIHIYFRDGSKISEPFVDITDRLLIGGSNERGLVGMGLHPDFAANKRFYIYYTTRNSDGVEVARLSEMRVSDGNPNRAKDSFSDEKIILDLVKPRRIHHGGQILFDSHKYLYLFVGDGGIQGDPENWAQNKSILLGKILRLDVSDPDVTYKIPPDNPFVGVEGTKPEIYATGLRNPYSGGIDRGDSKTGYGIDRIIFGDVGWGQWEEVNVLASNGGGSNFGWNIKKGIFCMKKSNCPMIENEVLPVRNYSHSEGTAVIGGSIYRGCMNPKLNGVYFYGDYGWGRLWTMIETKKGTNNWNHEDMLFCDENQCNSSGLTVWKSGHVYGFAEDVGGEVYILSTTTNKLSTRPPGGRIHRIVDPFTLGMFNADCSG